MTAVIRTHGVEKELSQRLYRLAERNPYFTVTDCTCPFVEKIHRIVSENSSADNATLIFGDREHPEVRGIESCVRGEAYIFSSAQELTEQIIPLIPPDKEIIVVSQTTQKLSEWKKCQKILEKLYTNPKIFDTICSVTENRQAETLKLASEVDVMIVIGGRNSSNTTKLFSIAQRCCPEAYLIQNVEEARGLHPPKGAEIGITAGASTPDSIIEEVQTIMSEEIKVDEVVEEKPENGVEESAVQATANDTTAAEPVVTEEAPEAATAEESFAQMLDETFKTINTGDVVTGVITSIGPTELHLDLGAKVTGILSYDDITDEPGVKLDEMFKVGDQVTAYAVRVSDVDGMATLSKKRYDAKSNWQTIVDAEASGEYLEGKFVEVVKGGAICVIKGTKAFVPASHTTVERDGDMNSILGKKMLFKIIEIDPARKRVKASARIPARAAEREARKAIEAKFWEEIEVGKFYEGTVRSIQSYGAFVELVPGIDGMVHTTELSWNHIKSPTEVVAIGDLITVFVKGFDKEKKRISLGYKTDETNPWNVFTTSCKVGDIVTVKVVNLMPFGAFGEIIPGVDGLIHISELADHKVGKPDDVVKIGDVVDVKIIEINEEKHQVGLSIRALLVPEEEAEYTEAEATEDVAETDAE